MSEALDRLRRWEDAGATWRIVARRPGDEIALLTCDAGAQVDRIVTTDREVLGYVDDAAADPPA